MFSVGGLRRRTNCGVVKERRKLGNVLYCETKDKEEDCVCLCVCVREGEREKYLLESEQSLEHEIRVNAFMAPPR